MLVIAVVGIAANLVAVRLLSRSRAAQPQHRGQPPARRHRPLRGSRDGGRGGPDPDGGLRAGRPDRLPADRRDHDPGRACRSCGPRHGCSSRLPPRAWTPRRSERRWPPRAASWKSTTSMCGKSQAVSRRCRPTCSWARTATATRSAGAWRRLLHERFGLDHTTLQVDHRGRRAARDRPLPTAAVASAPTDPPRDLRGRCALPAPTVYVHLRSPEAPGSAPPQHLPMERRRTAPSGPAAGLLFSPAGIALSCDLRRQGSAYKTSNEQL